MGVKAGDTFVKLKNPYTFGVPVRGEGKFFGREQELRLIFDTLENVPRGQKQDLVVLGPRRIGKSSLLYRLNDLLEPSGDFVPVYVDVQNTKPRKNRILFLKILSAIQRGYQQKAKLPRFETLESDDIPADLEFLTFDEDMTRLNTLIAAQNLPRLVLMFDEVELLIEFGGRDTLDWLRSLIQSMTYVIFVVAGSEQLYNLTQDYGSPFYNIFKTVELRPLTPQAARKLLKVPATDIGLEITLDEIDKILRYAGNNPYLINGIAHYLVEELNQQKRHLALPQDVDSVIKSCIENLSPQFAYIWGKVFAVDKIILYALAKTGHPETIDRLISKLPKSKALKTLTRSRQEQQDIFDGLVQQQILRESRNRYWFAALLFADWILSRVDDKEIIKLSTLPPITEPKIDRFDSATIRELLIAAFDDEELNQLAFDYFRPVYEEFSSGMSKGAKIQRLLAYCDRQGRLETLLELVQKYNPAQYVRFAVSL